MGPEGSLFLEYGLVLIFPGCSECREGAGGRWLVLFKVSSLLPPQIPLCSVTNLPPRLLQNRGIVCEFCAVRSIRTLFISRLFIRIPCSVSEGKILRISLAVEGGADNIMNVLCARDAIYGFVSGAAPRSATLTIYPSFGGAASQVRQQRDLSIHPSSQT
ncbi:hypothetical protein VTG60DRAFT_4411 [Thermothelomyces hinnuleus]